MTKILTYQQANYLPRLHEELMAAIPGLRSVPAASPPPGHPDALDPMMAITAEAETITLAVPDATSEAEIEAVLAAHDPTPPILVWEFTETKTVAEKVVTTDGLFHPVYRLATTPQTLYRATFAMSAIDRASFDVKDSEARLVFKRSATMLSQVGATIALGTAQDAAAASWTIQGQPDGTDLVIGVRGAAGRTIDWILAGAIALFAPAGVAP